MMDPIDKHLKSLIKTKDNKGTIDINLHVGDITAIIECLNFAYTAAKVVAEIELKRGSTEGIKKIARIQKDSLELCHILAGHLDIGNPDSDEIN